MKVFASLFIVCLCLVGCSPGGDANNAPSPDQTNSVSNTPATPTGAPSGQGGGVAPMASGAAGGMTPMSGTESVGGEGGGGVGQAAKQMAKDKAGNMGSGSLGQGEKDDSSQ